MGDASMTERIVSSGEQARWSLRVAPSIAARITMLGGFRLALDINRCAAEAGGRLSARLGPDEWLLCAPAADQLPSTADAQLADALPATAGAQLAGEHYSLVDVGHRYQAFELAAPNAPFLLAAGCPLDLHPSVFGPGCATRTLLGKAEIILWRLPRSYRVECGRTFAKYVEAFLREAARELTGDSGV
jgi:sarcosine oxidase subunit gamma